MGNKKRRSLEEFMSLFTPEDMNRISEMSKDIKYKDDLEEGDQSS